MKKSLCFIFMLAFSIQIGRLTELKAETHPRLKSAQEETALEVLFNRVLIYRKDGGPLSGLLVGVEGDMLIVRVGTKDERIHRNNLEKAVIQKEHKKGSYALSGVLLGMYITNVAFLRAENQPPFFMDDIDAGWGFFLGNVLYMSAGGTLGILAGLGSENGKIAFEFTGNVEKRNREWERLRRFVIGDTYITKKLHLKFQAGKIFPRVSDRYMDLMLENGLQVSGSGWMEGETWEETNKINLLRKVQLTYSLNTLLDVGIASCWIGEPSIQGTEWGSHESRYSWQKLSATGFYAVGVFKPFQKMMPKIISWEFGVGAGAAKINFRLKAQSTTWNPHTEITDEYSLSKTLFSGIAFTELSLYPYDAISLGLIADYVFVPVQQAPAMPTAGLPAQKLRFGNSSIGLSFGFHF